MLLLSGVGGDGPSVLTSVWRWFNHLQLSQLHVSQLEPIMLLWLLSGKLSLVTVACSNRSAGEHA